MPHPVARFRSLFPALALLVVTVFLGSMHGRASAAEESSSPSSSTSNARSTSRSSEPASSPASQETLAEGDKRPEPEGPVRGHQPSTTLGGGFAGGFGSVDSATGTAHATVPFQLPQARGGAQPQLGLSYNSSADVGEAGYGWSLGLPKIDRHNLSNGPRYDDPLEGEAIDPNRADWFEYAGSPIVPICLVRDRQCTNGTALQPGEELPISLNGWMYFRPQVDHGFLRLFWSGDHRTWLAQVQGVTYELGAPLDQPSNDGALDFDPVANAGTPPIFRWNVVRQRDGNGMANVIYYDWQKLAAPTNGTTDNLGYLTDVYTTAKSSGAETIPRQNFAHHARLVYSREKPIDSFQGAVVWRRPLAWRLHHVDVTSADFADTGRRHLVRRYELSHRWGEHFGQARSFLASVHVRPSCTIQENEAFALPDDITPDCGGDKKPVAEMSYVGDSVTHPGEFGEIATPRTFYDPITFVDIDNDSVADMLEESTGLGQYVTLMPPGSHPRQQMAVHREEAGLFVTARSLLFNNSKLGDWFHLGHVDVLHHEPDATETIRYDQDPRWTIFTAQFKGSGAREPWVWHGGLPNQNRFAGWWDNVHNEQPGGGMGGVQYPPISFYADVDLDGYLDRFVLKPVVEARVGGPRLLGYKQHVFRTTVERAGLQVKPFSQNTPHAEFNQPTPLPEEEQPITVDMETMIDVTNDHVPDLLRHYTDPPSIRGWKAWFGIGNGLVEGPHTSFGFAGRYLHDVNADRISDYISFKDDGPVAERYVEVYFGHGRGTVSSARFPFAVEDETYLQFADIDGSGVDSIILLSKKSPKVKYIKWAPSPITGGRTGMLTSISNGYGARTDFQYTKTGASQPDGAHLPTSNYHVTKSVTWAGGDQADGGPYTTEYAYRDPVYDNLARRFRGFRFLKEIHKGFAATETSLPRRPFWPGTTTRWIHPALRPPATQEARVSPTIRRSR